MSDNDNCPHCGYEIEHDECECTGTEYGGDVVLANEYEPGEVATA